MNLVVKGAELDNRAAMGYPDRKVNIKMTRRPNNEARDRIIKTAYELFASAGYESVSMEKVAAAAGLKKANLFHYYPSKEALGVAVIAEAVRRHSAGVQSLFEDDAQDPLTAVRALFERGSVGLRGNCSRGCFIGKMSSEIDERNAEMRRRLSGCLGEWRQELSRYLGGWKKRGYFKASFKPEETADGVLSLYEGSLLLAAATDDAGVVDHARRVAAVVLVSWKA
jgi:TetR/AcrR family transcriptional repressor of nem operon